MNMLFHQAFHSALLLAAAALPAAVSFESEVKPIFEKHCVECHGPKKQKSDFRLDDREVALHGGESHAPNILPGKPDESPLIKFVTTTDRDTRMPPKGERLTAAEVDMLKRWIAEGAVWPESASLKKSDPLDWWSLKPPCQARPALRRRHPPHRPLHPGQAPGETPAALRHGRRPHHSTAPELRPDRPAAHGRRTRGFRARSDPRPARRHRPGRRSPAGLTPLWRTLGTPLARRGPLRRHPRLR